MNGVHPGFLILLLVFLAILAIQIYEENTILTETIGKVIYQGPINSFSIEPSSGLWGFNKSLTIITPTYIYTFRNVKNIEYPDILKRKIIIKEYRDVKNRINKIEIDELRCK